VASADWRHLGRLAGFTNQKLVWRQHNGYPPWVRLLHAQRGLAGNGTSLVVTAERQVTPGVVPAARSLPRPSARDPVILTGHPSPANEIYQHWLNRLQIPQRFPQPDWSIADKWIAKELLRQGTPAAAVEDLLRRGSPGFPRRHADPEDYLHRTLARAFYELGGLAFPAPPRGARCVADR
jgi:hypothetical protein